ncbi:MAG: hypothetical protein HYR75_04495 [Gemmatimonadetes bacterium]|nr:hypothetical protein [Gemmatimonadota bacterium]MBI3569442.1 hypothetical protein [Gemmatimonadota bacterium]
MNELDRELAAAERVGRAIIHEARNVLTPITSAAFLLDTHADDPAKVRELAKKIEVFAKAEERLVAKMRAVLDRERLGDTASAVSPTGAPAPSAPSSTVPPK